MIPTFITADEFLTDDAILNKALEKQNITKDEEKEVFSAIALCVKEAARYISTSIMKNAEITDEEIAEYQAEFLYKAAAARTAGERMPIIGYDVLDMQFSDKIVSPYESEKAYIAGLAVVNTFMTPALFIHANEIEADLAGQNADKTYE